MEIKKEVVICSKCEGNGTIRTFELIDHHRGIYEPQITLCSRCGGTGRMVRVETVEYSKLGN